MQHLRPDVEIPSPGGLAFYEFTDNGVIVRDKNPALRKRGVRE